MNRVVFSIVVPVYNVQDFLEDSIKSVIGQGCKNYEIIAVDDGSTDNSSNLCDEFAKTLCNFRVIHKENEGLSDARNIGILNAKGDYIVFLDSDDLLASKALENLEKIISKNNPDIIISRRAAFIDLREKFEECGYFFEKDKLNKMNAARQYEYIQKFKDCWLGAWIFVINRKYLLNHKLFFYKGILHEDEEWVPRVFFSGGKIDFNNELLYVNRMNREGGITTTYNIKREFDLLKIIKLLTEEFGKDKYDYEMRQCIKKRTQSIFFKIVHDLKYYRKNDEYIRLLGEIEAMQNILVDAKKYNTFILKWLIKVFGVEKASRIIEVL